MALQIVSLARQFMHSASTRPFPLGHGRETLPALFANSWDSARWQFLPSRHSAAIIPPTPPLSHGKLGHYRVVDPHEDGWPTFALGWRTI